MRHQQFRLRSILSVFIPNEAVTYHFCEQSDEIDDDDDEGQGGFMKRKKIRKVMKNKKLTSETKQAQKAEEERRKRIAERQKEVRILIEITNSKEILLQRPPKFRCLLHEKSCL